MIQGVLDAEAPMYDARAQGLRGEGEVRALELGVKTEIQRKEVTAPKVGVEDGKEGGGDEALKSSSRPVSPALRLTPPAEDLHRSVMSLAVLRENAPTASTPRYGFSFLAASAPGSRLASRSASPSGLRPTSSHVGLVRLGAIRGHSSPFTNNNYFEANSPTEDGPSHHSSAVGYLPGLGDHALSAGDLARPGISERVKPCAIHGEECDGVSIERACLTEETKKGFGFVGEVPMIEAGGSQMVDWAALLQEAKAEEGY